MPALKMLDLSANQLSGTLPVDWSGASNLVMLLLSNNSFSGKALAALRPTGALHVSYYQYHQDKAVCMQPRAIGYPRRSQAGAYLWPQSQSVA